MPPNSAHWVYVVYFFRKYPPDVAVYCADHFYIPVLMDGRVIMPRCASAIKIVYLLELHA